MRWLLKKVLAPVIREVIEEEITKGIKRATALGQIIIGVESGKGCAQEDVDRWNRLSNEVKQHTKGCADQSNNDR